MTQVCDRLLTLVEVAQEACCGTNALACPGRDTEGSSSSPCAAPHEAEHHPMRVGLEEYDVMVREVREEFVGPSREPLSMLIPAREDPRSDEKRAEVLSGLPGRAPVKA